MDSEKNAIGSDQVLAFRKFNRFYTKFLGLLNENLYGADISLTEARVLWEIGRHELRKAADLIDTLAIDRGYLSRILKRMEKNDLISRRPDPSDKRVRTLFLTAKGRQLLLAIELRSSKQIETILKQLPAQERALLVQHLGEVERLLSLAGTH